jgi:hypothetical protein
VLAHLISTRRYVHHLNIAPMGIRSPQAFLANVCAQLIVRYGLDHAFLPDAATRDGGFLTRLLTEAGAVPANQPLVVVVDALDEAETHVRSINTGASRNLRLYRHHPVTATRVQLTSEAPAPIRSNPVVLRR